MRKFAIALAATTALAMSAGTASAARWLPIIERTAMFEARVDAGLASGELTAEDARALRTDFDALVSTEGRFRMNGLTANEKLDLDRRYAALSDRVAMMRTAGPRWMDRDGLWIPVEARKAELDRRIERGIANGDLTEAEADRLRDEFDDIMEAEAAFRVDGFTAAEQADLDRRFNRLAAQIRWERRDGQRDYGASRY